MTAGTARAFTLIILLVFAAPLSGGEDKYVTPEGTRGGEMVLVPAGDFKMGCNRRRDRHCDSDERPYHSVYLSAFYIDRHEVTNAEYSKCVRDLECREVRKYTDFDGPNQPVVGVSWQDAAAFCEWAGKTLPTEAQWEKAARGGDGRVYPWGNHTCGCDCAIQEWRQEYGCGKDAPWPVGSAEKGSSPYGALDMAGNVWEWVADWYGPRYYRDPPDKDPKGPETGEHKVKRGGGYANIRNYLRTSDRSKALPASVSKSTGFRCALKAPEKEKKDKGKESGKEKD